MEPRCPAPLCFTAGLGDTGTDYNTITQRQVDAGILCSSANSGCALLSGARRLQATRGLPNLKGIKSFIVRMSGRTTLRRWNYLYSLDFKWRLIETLNILSSCWIKKQTNKHTKKMSRSTMKTSPSPFMISYRFHCKT